MLYAVYTLDLFQFFGDVMNISDHFISQYNACLWMLKNTITISMEFPQHYLWNAETEKNRYWHIAYHTLFYTDLYLAKDNKSFMPWALHQEDYHLLSPEALEPYYQEELLSYLNKINSSLKLSLENCNFEKHSGFSWLPFNKFELHIHNIRHIQHHTGQLVERIREKRHIEVDWIVSPERERQLRRLATISALHAKDRQNDSETSREVVLH